MQQGSATPTTLTATTATTMIPIAPSPPTTGTVQAAAAAAAATTTTTTPIMMMNENGTQHGDQQHLLYHQQLLQQQQQSDVDKTKLIVNYIPQFATEEDLAELFGPIGKIENIKIMRDYKTGYSFGFGFVKYFAIEDAAKAIELLNGMNYKNKRLKVSYSRPPAADMKDSNLYITNLPKDVTEEDVHNIFSNYGEIVQKSVLKDKITGMPRGVAFVRFSKGEEAQAAIANLDGKLLENAMFPLSVRVAEDHGRQKAQYLDSWGMPMYNNRAGVMPFRGVRPSSSSSSSSSSPSSTISYRNHENHDQNQRNGGGGGGGGGANYNNNNGNMGGGAGDNYHLSFYC